MKEEELKELTVEELKKKQKGIKTLMFLFIPVIIGLGYFSISDYLNGQQDMPVSIIAVCSIGGLFALFKPMRQIKAELESRN